MLRSVCCPAPKLCSTKASNASRRSALAFCQTRRSGIGLRGSGRSTLTIPCCITTRLSSRTDRWCCSRGCVWASVLPCCSCPQSPAPKPERSRPRWRLSDEAARVPPLAFSEVGYGRRFRLPPGKRAPWRDTRIACQTSITGRGTGRNIRFDPGFWLSLFSALRRQGLTANKLVLQLTTFLRSLDLFLELIVLTTSTLTANQVRHGGKQGTHNPELLCIHSSPPSIDFTPAEPPA